MGNRFSAIFIIISIFVFIIAAFLYIYAFRTLPASEVDVLPTNYKVYYRADVGVINHPIEGAAEKTLPTINDYTGSPGCYIACYSHDAKNGIYPVGGDIFVMGQIRVPGDYENRICQPSGYQHQDISQENTFKQQCQQAFPACKNLSCWAGGDTGGWFGIPF